MKLAIQWVLANTSTYPNTLPLRLICKGSEQGGPRVQDVTIKPRYTF